jgi:hypothetical protein
MARSADAPRVSADRVVVAAVAIAGTVAVLNAVIPRFRFAYRSPDLRAATTTTTVLVGALVASLVLGHFLRGRRAADLATAAGIALLSLASLTQLVLPRVLRLGNDDAVAIWVPVWIRLLGAGALALGAVLPERYLARLGRGAIAFGTSLVVASIAAAALISTGLERQLDVKVDPGASASPDLASTPAVTVSQLLLASLFAVAAVGFLRQARRSQQPLDTWLAVGSAVAAVARVQYAL